MTELEVCGRILAIDPGTKRVGFALSDELQRLARPLEVWRCRSKKADVQRVVELARAHHVREVIVGVPYPLEGPATPSTERARAFARSVKGALGSTIRVTEWDEALTSWAAEGVVRVQAIRAPERRRALDPVAAAVLLQELLDTRGS